MTDNRIYDHWDQIIACIRSGQLSEQQIACHLRDDGFRRYYEEHSRVR